jgi:iron complex outermembrane receptor protein
VTASLEKAGAAVLLSGSLYRSGGEENLYFREFASTHGGVATGLDGDRYGQFFGDVQYGNIRLQGLYSSRDKSVPTAFYGTVFNMPANTRDSRGYADISYHRNLSATTDADLRAYYDLYDSSGGGMMEAGPGTDLKVESLGHADWAGGEASVGHQIGRHRIVIGGNFEYNLGISQENRMAGQPSIVLESHQVWQTAVYADAEWKIVPKISFRTGGRLDYFNAFGSHFSPRLAVIYSPTSRTTVKYIFGEAFRAPNAYESDYVDGVVVERMRVSLRPETSQSHEVVLERAWAPWLTMSVGGFYEWLQNLIDQVPDSATGLTYFANSGRDLGRGIELEWQAKSASGWLARASYTLEDGEDDIRNQPLANSPLHSAKLNASVPLGRHLLGGAEFSYLSAQQSYVGLRVPPWFLSNWTLSSRALHGWELSASCYNALDRRFFNPAGPEDRQAMLLQEGRSFRFKLSYRLGLGERGH